MADDPHTMDLPRSSEALDHFLPAYLAAKRAFKPIQKTQSGVNADDPYDRYRYADLSDHLRAVEPALLEHGLLLEQDVLVHGELRFLMMTRLLHAASGQWRASYLPMQPTTHNDPHVTGSRLTYARRYGLALFLGLAPVGEDDDGAVARVAADDPAPVVRKARAPKVAKGEPAPAGEGVPFDPPEAAQQSGEAPPQAKTVGEVVRELMQRVAALVKEGVAPGSAWLQNADLLRHPLMSDRIVEQVFDTFMGLYGEPPPPVKGVTYPSLPQEAAHAA